MSSVAGGVLSGETLTAGGPAALISRRELTALVAACLLAVTVAAVVAPRYVGYLAAVNASLNGTAAVLLVTGYVLIKRRRERAHTLTMLAAFAVSIVFLACYLMRISLAGSKPFLGQGAVRPLYFAILISHVVLAALVPVLAGSTIYLGLRDRRASHRRIAQWTFPIWLYVSVTGVVIYVMLYHLYPA